MGNINTNNLSTGLFDAAVKTASNGSVSSAEKANLQKLAAKDGINADEKKLLQGLDLKSNVNVLKKAASKHEPKSITFFNATEDKSQNLKAAGASGRAVRKFEKMSASQQAQFETVQSNTKVKSDLFKLLAKGTLTKKDSKQTTVLNHLEHLQTDKLKPGVDGKYLADNLIQTLSDRSCITQGSHGTCGAASMENVLVKKDPAEVVRIVSDLATKGEVKTRGGHTMHAGTNSLNWHKGDKMTDGSKETRNDMDIIFQSATMRSVALVGGDLDLLLGGAADYNVNKDNSDGSSVSTGDSASDPIFVKSLMQNITGQDYDQDHLWGTYSEMKTHANQGKEPIALYTTSGGGMHYVTVTSVKDGKVNFYNTATTGSRGRADSMSEADFKSKLLGTITVD